MGDEIDEGIDDWRHFGVAVPGDDNIQFQRVFERDTYQFFVTLAQLMEEKTPIFARGDQFSHRGQLVGSDFDVWVDVAFLIFVKDDLRLQTVLLHDDQWLIGDILDI